MAATISDEARRKANLRVLQRLDSSILDIEGSATHVVLYEFSDDKQKWEKRNVEGSLFVAKRSDAPRFKLIVLNRNSRDTFEVPVTGKFQMQVRDPYLIFREEKSSIGEVGGNNGHKILGVWFHDGKEREAVSALLSRIVESLTAGVEETEERRAENGGKPLGGRDDSSATVDRKEERQAATPVDAGAAASALLSPLALSPGERKQQEGREAADPATAPASAAVPASPVASAAAHRDDAPAAHPQQQQHPQPHQNLVLDKKSLQLSLLSLIQDERFLDLIHAQYLKVAHARANRDSQQQK